METDSAPPPRLGASLCRVCETVLGMLRNRVELFALELQEEKSWLISTLLWSAATVFFGGLSILLVIGTVVFLAPESARGWILGGVAVFFSFITINAITGLRRS